MRNLILGFIVVTLPLIAQSKEIVFDTNELWDLPAIRVMDLVIVPPTDPGSLRAGAVLNFQYRSCVVPTFQSNLEVTRNTILVKVAFAEPVSECWGPKEVRTYSVKISSGLVYGDKIVVLNPVMPSAR